MEKAEIYFLNKRLSNLQRFLNNHYAKEGGEWQKDDVYFFYVKASGGGYLESIAKDIQKAVFHIINTNNKELATSILQYNTEALSEINTFVARNYNRLTNNIPEEALKEFIMEQRGYMESIAMAFDNISEWLNETNKEVLPPELDTPEATEANVLPPELDTPEAKELLQRLVDNGYCEALTYKWIKGTMYQQAQSVYNICRILWKTNKWKPFEKLWEVGYMAQTYQRIMSGANNDSIITINDLFPEAKKLE